MQTVDTVLFNEYSLIELNLYAVDETKCADDIGLIL